MSTVAEGLWAFARGGWVWLRVVRAFLLQRTSKIVRRIRIVLLQQSLQRLTKHVGVVVYVHVPFHPLQLGPVRGDRPATSAATLREEASMRTTACYRWEQLRCSRRMLESVRAGGMG